ncbi:unnamed protein product [Meganyctiphanes norvegica]|uniref:Uncharacterized protein n=1 Tax=Meganyctiphanes norvegica TaxID=48144 RepID=A0AAV2PKG6_MEGNR
MANGNTLDVNCGICKVIVEEDSEGLFCDVCNSWFHNDCNKTPLDYELYALLNEAPKNVKWFCDKCIWETEKWIKEVNSKQSQILNYNKELHNEHNPDRTPQISEIKVEIDDEYPENWEFEGMSNSLDLGDCDPPEDTEEVTRIKQKRKLKKKSSVDNVCNNVMRITETIKTQNMLNLRNISQEKLLNITDGILSVNETNCTRTKCNLCPKTFINLDDCIAHRLSDHEGVVKKPYKCSICKKNWKTKNSLTIHMRIHKDKKPKQPKLQLNRGAECGYTKPQQTSLQSSEAHQYKDKEFSDIDVKPYKCSICNKKWKTKKSCEMHMRIHTDKKPKQPKLQLNRGAECGYTKPQQTSLQSSEAHQYKNKQFSDIDSSNHVTKEIQNSQGLLHSLQENPQELPENEFGVSYEDDAESLYGNEPKEKDDDYMGDGAESAISSNSEGSNYDSEGSDYIYNTKRFHKKYQCKLCDNSFTINSALKNHMKTHNSFKCSICEMGFLNNFKLKIHMRVHTGEKPYQCSHCDKVFSQKATLGTHMKSHTGNNQFRCKICDKVFKHDYTLKVHIRRHTGEKPYQCDQCEKAFVTTGMLQRHKKEHTGEKPFLCNHCGKAFSENKSLVRHLKIHSGEKPYKCNQCDKSFVQNDQLTSHVRIHTGEKPYLCSYCGMGYSHNCQLKAHMRTHGDEPKKSMEPL